MPRSWSTALKASSPCRSHVVLAAGRAPDRQLLTLVDVPVTSPHRWQKNTREGTQALRLSPTTQAVHSADSTSACSSTVRVAFSCLSGG